jgi:predicted lysophospholipase L1 biosynthesis ABC-type transport system permease subunit
MKNEKPDTFTTEVIASRRVTVDQSLAELWGIEIGDKLTLKICGVNKKEA